jgi:hypothetical protein
LAQNGLCVLIGCSLNQAVVDRFRLAGRGGAPTAERCHAWGWGGGPHVGQGEALIFKFDDLRVAIFALVQDEIIAVPRFQGTVKTQKRSRRKWIDLQASNFRQPHAHMHTSRPHVRLARSMLARTWQPEACSPCVL